MIDFLKEHRYKIAVIVSLSIVAFSFLIVLTYSKFHATTEVDDSARVAFFLGDRFKTKDVRLGDIAPGESKDIFIDISNSEGTKTIETSMRYIIEVEDFGSLPLEYELYGVASPNDIKDNNFNATNGYRREGTMSVGSEQTDEYKLVISWPDTGDDARDIKYANELKVIRLKLQAEQID